MKRNTLAVLIPALLAAGATQAVEVYNKDGNQLNVFGRAAGLHYFSHNEHDAGDQTYVRFGFKGQTQINDQVIGYGLWEYNVQANNSEGGPDVRDGNKTRLAFAGLSFADVGSIDYGRNYGVVYDAIGWTDILPEFGGDSGLSDNFMNGRSTGLFTYRNANFFGLVDGLDFALQYQGKNERTLAAPAPTNVKAQVDRHSNGEGWGGSMSYVLPMGLGVSAAYSASDRTLAQQKGSYVSEIINHEGGVIISNAPYTVGQGKKAESWATAVKYDANNIYLAVMYGETHNLTPFNGLVGINAILPVAGFVDKTENFEAVAQYLMDMGNGSGLRPSLAYVQSRGKAIIGNPAISTEHLNFRDDLYKYIEVGATYFFNKNISAYVDYRINQLNKNNELHLSNDDIVATGLVYQF